MCKFKTIVILLSSVACIATQAHGRPDERGDESWDEQQKSNAIGMHSVLLTAALADDKAHGAAKHYKAASPEECESLSAALTHYKSSLPQIELSSEAKAEVITDFLKKFRHQGKNYVNEGIFSGRVETFVAQAKPIDMLFSNYSGVLARA
jgi:hypothetical protein